MPATSDLQMIVAEYLCPGDVIVDQLFDDQPNATVLRWAEWDKDQFGRYMMRFWCRADDGREGFMSYGPGGIVHIKAKS